MFKISTVLTAKGRNQVKGDNFVFPEDRRYPIHDMNHARSALSMVAAHGTPFEKAKVRSAVYNKYPSLKDGAMEKKAAIYSIKSFKQLLKKEVKNGNSKYRPGILKEVAKKFKIRGKGVKKAIREL